MIKEEIKENQAKAFLDYVLMFAHNNSAEFLKSRQMKETNYTEKELNNLVYNYINHRQLKIDREI